MTSPIIELGYLGFEVSDLARWDEFSTTVLGAVPHLGPDQPREVGDEETEGVRIDGGRHIDIVR